MDAKSLREKAVRDAKSALILNAARTIFAQKGFHEARLEDIAAESGFSKASLYNYYTDKEEIFLSLATREFDDFLNRLVSAINESDPFFMNLERIIRTSIEFFGEHFAFVVSMTGFQMFRQYDPKRLIEHHYEMLQKFRERFSTVLNLYTTLIEKAQRLGEVTNELPAESISSYIGSLVRGMFMEWKLRGAMGDVSKEADRLFAFIRFGIAVPVTGNVHHDSDTEHTDK